MGPDSKGSVTNFGDPDGMDRGLFACTYPLGSGLIPAPVGGRQRLWEVHVRMTDCDL